ncbi:MAG: tetratricopeptide repeat protein [Endomicrobiales bacterium]|nr:tetratricopeptide repeat protein [Endomicrobiales bacterium]
MKKAGLVLLGILLSVAVLEVGLRGTAYVILKVKDYRNRIIRGDENKYIILCLGESTTDRQYPKYLEQELNSRDMGVKFKVIDEGKAGYQTNHILMNLEANIEKYSPDMIITMMGVNDSNDEIVFEIVEDKNVIKNLKLYKLFKLLGLHIKSTLSIGRYEGREKAILKKQDLTESEYENIKRLMDLGNKYKEEKEYLKAEKIYKEVISRHPCCEWGYVGLGYTYKDQGRFEEAEEYFLKILKQYSDNFLLYTAINNYYFGENKEKELEKEYDDLIKNNPDNPSVYFGLAHLYQILDIYEKAKKFYKKGIEIHRSLSGKEHSGLELNSAEIDLVLKRIQGKRVAYYSLTTGYNYNRLKNAVLSKGIKLVSMQYPMRSIEPLKKLLKPSNGIIFVENKESFENAVNREGSEIYFDDMFAKDFGHCTVKGNKLIAKNIADVLEKEVFKGH